MPHSPAIADSYSLLVRNVHFRTTVDDLVPLFENCGKIVDISIPRDRRTGESRGFAFVRYLYKDEAQMAVNRLNGMLVGGRQIAVQFAKYGPNSEPIREGRIVENPPQGRVRSRSRSPSRRYRDDYGERDYRRRSRSRSLDRYERERYYEEERGYGQRDDYGGRDYKRRSRSRSLDRNERERHYEEERDFWYRRNRGYNPDYGRDRDRR
ncbi:hypothetical protein CASFOL_035843 [Castilleja foliolosa]|uniref:RRM domain-containing protein n=1 Tax=Castilleja foliolosa TaxID=1961234 RepID=A0ABD3BTU4_9LAMI